MIKQCFRIAIRNLGRQKALALINVLGLSLGLTCFIVFLLYAVNEFGYDRFHKRAGDIFRVIEWEQGLPEREPGGSAGLSMVMGPTLAQDFPGSVERFVRFRSRGNILVQTGDRLSRLTVSFADTSFFSVFTFPLLSGSPAQALNGTHNVVLTRDMAMRFFGRIDVDGRLLRIKLDTGFQTFLITGVAENPPANSILSFGLLIGFPYCEAHADPQAMTDWYETMGDETFVLLRPGNGLASHLVDFRTRHIPTEAADLIKNKQWDGHGAPPISFRLQPLRDIHTNTSIDGRGDPVDPKRIWLLVGMAFSVLLIACINFTTLSIGRSAGRAKEIGVRKVMGSRRRQLVYQFLAESLVLAFFSTFLALILSFFLLPYLSGLTDVSLHLSLRQIPMLLGVALFTGLIAGAYPALVLSGFKPLEVFHSKVRLSGSNLFTRSLVVLQFVLSAGLVTATVIILQQVSYLRARDLGFNKEHVIDVDASGVDTKRMYPAFRSTLLSSAGITGVTAAEIGMGEGFGFMGSGYSYRGKGGGSLEYPVEPGYIHLMGMSLLRGHDFGPSDSVHYLIVNQALLREYNISPDSAIGQTLMQNDQLPCTIIGVVKDFNYVSLAEQVRPQLFYWPSALSVNHIYVRVSPGDPSRALSRMAGAWRSLVPNLTFQYHFLDEEMDRFYEPETKWSRIIGLAGSMAICLACLGLFGLAALVAVNRYKEIGIRKVLGASVASLVRLLSLEFTRLVFLGLLISVPLAWYFMHRWLQGYANRISIHWWVFAMTAVVMLGLALLTVGAHALKAALGNPAERLRTE